MTFTHGEAEAMLLALHPGAAALLLGVACRRDRSGWCWSVGFGPDRLLLPAIDAVLALAGFRAASEERGPDGRRNAAAGR
jgi:hypothetical protein